MRNKLYLCRFYQKFSSYPMTGTQTGIRTEKGTGTEKETERGKETGAVLVTEKWIQKWKQKGAKKVTETDTGTGQRQGLGQKNKVKSVEILWYEMVKKACTALKNILFKKC